MKGEIVAYNALVKAIKPLAQRLDAKKKDTFTLAGFWRENEEGKGIDAFAFVLRAVARAGQLITQLHPAGGRLLHPQRHLRRRPGPLTFRLH